MSNEENAVSADAVVPAVEVPLLAEPVEAEVTPQMQNPEVSPQESESPRNTEAAPPEVIPEAEVVQARPAQGEPASPPAGGAPAASTPAPFHITSLRGAALNAYRAKKHDRKESIFELKSLKRVIKNGDVVRHVRVCARTAGEYLNELSHEGRLEKIGLGRGVRYKFVE